MKATEARHIIEQGSAGAITPVAAMFLQDAIKTMTPWLFVMIAVIICDLVFGINKSRKLGIHISPSRALRATMSKMVTYIAWVMTVAMIDCAEGHNLSITRWACLLVCLIEGMSIIGNMLKPHGYDFSIKACIIFFITAVFRRDTSELNGIIHEERLDIIKERERKKWEDIKPNIKDNETKQDIN